MVAASGRSSPLTALSSSLPSSIPGSLYTDDRYQQRDAGEDGFGDGPWDEVEEGDTTCLSTLDAFRRRFDESGDGDEVGYRSHSDDEGEGVLGVDEREDEEGATAGKDEDEDEDGEGRKEGEDVNSDGEVGIGLSLMGALGGEEEEEDDEDEDEDEDEGDARRAREIRSGKDSELGAGDVGLRNNGNGPGVFGENGCTTPIAWTQYTPSSPVSAQAPNGHHRSGDEEAEDGDEEEDDEDDGAYWDHIYDDYRYSRYSLASKRFSAASRRVSVMSKASGASKASSKSRANAPPMPIPLDRPSSDTSRPSIGSDGTSGHPRPSFESASSSISASMSHSRPALIRTASHESTHRTHMLPLTAQFPAVPVHVPVRTESRLRVVHDGYMYGDDHGERELQVEHGSTEVELNIEVVEATQEDNAQDQELDVGRHLTSLSGNTALSPLLHTTFGSPHSSRFTDLEDISDQDHGRRHSNKSAMLSVEGPPKSPIEGGGMASALRATVEAERASSSGTASTHGTPAPAANTSPNEESEVHAIVVDDEEGHIPGINITVDDSVSETEVVSPLPTPTSNMTQMAVATDPVQAAPSADQMKDAEKSSFLRPRAQPNLLPHPFARTSIFLPHPNAPKPVHQSQGPMYGRTCTQTYAYPASSGVGAGNMTMQQPTPPGTTFFSTHVLHQLRNLSIAVSQGPARRPPMTLFARCQPDLSASMGPVPILFSLDPFPPLSIPLARPQTKVGGGKGVLYLENMTPTRAATVSAPVRSRGVVDGAPLHEDGSGVDDVSTLRLPKRSATAIASVAGPQGFDAGPSTPPSLPIPREGFVPQVGAARPRSRSFSAFGAHVPALAPQQGKR